MKTPTKAESMAKLAQWCVENSSETFSAFFDYSPHVSKVEVRVNNNGWDGQNEPSDILETYIDEYENAYVEEWVKTSIIQLNTLLAESNERNSPENAAKLQADRDAKELAKAKAVIERLEGGKVHLIDLSDNPRIYNE